jgi:hypothetical protein
VHGLFRGAFRDAPAVDVAGLGPRPVQLAWRAAVGAVWLVADGAMATSEILQRRRQRREVAVTYDGADRVVTYRLPRG